MADDAETKPEDKPQILTEQRARDQKGMATGQMMAGNACQALIEVCRQIPGRDRVLLVNGFVAEVVGAVFNIFDTDQAQLTFKHVNDVLVPKIIKKIKSGESAAPEPSLIVLQ